MSEENVTSVSAKGKRFRFDKEFDLLLVNLVGVTESHLAKHGEVEEKYTGVLNAFCSNARFLSKHAQGTPAPRVQTLRDRLNKLLTNRRAVNSQNIAASGTLEDYGELEKGLDVLIDECKEKKEEEGKAKQILKQKEVELTNAGKSIRDSAMKRSIEEPDESASTSTRKKRRVSKNVIDLTGDKELDLMEAEALHRREIENKKLELEERRVTLAEENQKVQLDLMRALIAKLG